QSDFGDIEKGRPFSREAVLHTFSRSTSQEEIEQMREDARTTTAKDIMTRDVVTDVEDTPVEELAREMLRYDIDHILVIHEGLSVGIVARHDFLRLLTGAVKHPSSRLVRAFE